MTISVRYTVLLNEKDQLDPGLFNIDENRIDINGRTHECRISKAVPEHFSGLVPCIKSFRLYSRHTDDHDGGQEDVLLRDAFIGTTIDIERFDQCAEVPQDQLAVVFELFRSEGFDIADRFNLSLVQIGQHDLHYSQASLGVKEIGQSHDWVDYSGSSEGQIPGYFELSWKHNAKTMSLTGITASALSVSLPRSYSSETEIGVIRRVERSLSDSQFEGLSSFLPQFSPRPFMIFFDQQLHRAESKQVYEWKLMNRGSHPHHVLSLKSGQINQVKHLSGCRTYVVSVLPREFFYDRYELQNRFRTPFWLYGEHDLEKPMWLTKSWGSILLLEIGNDDRNQDVEVPFHTRYIQPEGKSHAKKTTLAAPRLYTACSRTEQVFEDNPWHSEAFFSTISGNTSELFLWNNRGSSQVDFNLATFQNEDPISILLLTTLAIIGGVLYCLLMLRSRSFKKT